MLRLFFLWIFPFLLCANELKREIEFTDNVIYSTDIVPSVNKQFEVLKIPNNKNHFRIESAVIAKTFELNGIDLNTSNIQYMTFIKKSTANFNRLSEQLQLKLVRHYPEIVIKSIRVTSHNYIETIPNNAEAIVDRNFYNNPEGTFYILDEHGLRRYLDYHVDATLPLLYTSKDISRKDILNGQNTLIKNSPFVSFRDEPLISIPDQMSRFRTSLKTGKVVLSKNIEPLPLVLKGEKVVAVIKNGVVVVEIGAIAVQEGALYDIITIQKNDGKRVKAKVIGEKRVELQ